MNHDLSTLPPLQKVILRLLDEHGPCTYVRLAGPARRDLPDPVAAGLALEALRELGLVTWDGSPAVYRLVPRRS